MEVDGGITVVDILRRLDNQLLVSGNGLSRNVYADTNLQRSSHLRLDPWRADLVGDLCFPLFLQAYEV
jgi:hypothetical protein